MKKSAYRLPQLDRRRFVQGATAMVGLAALRGFAVDNPNASAWFTHGVASGDPLSDRVMLWTRAIPSAPMASRLNVQWQIADDHNFKRIINEGEASADVARDYTVKVDATGLKAGTSYFYRFIANGVTSPTGRTRTLPVGTAKAVTLGVASCGSYPHGYFHAYQHMAQAELDAVVFLGDYIYEYPEGYYGDHEFQASSGRHLKPEHEVVGLEDYRQRYGLYRSDPALQAAHAAHPWIIVWDDHELANNTWRAGAENHNAGDGDFDQRIRQARTAWHEWMPVRTLPGGDQSAIFRRFQFGDLVDLVMLDTRLHGRDRPYDYRVDIPKGMSPAVFRDTVLADHARTILGYDQERWLGEQLTASSARWQVLGQQVIMGNLNAPELAPEDRNTSAMKEPVKSFAEAILGMSEHQLPLNLDAWDGYPACRDRVKALLQRSANPVVLAGDSHNAWAFNLQDASGNSIGVELATPGISSPGMDSFLPLPEDALLTGFKASSPELYAADLSHRGWSELKFTSRSVTGQWHFVNSNTTVEHEVEGSQTLVCEAGSRRWTMA